MIFEVHMWCLNENRLRVRQELTARSWKELQLISFVVFISKFLALWENFENFCEVQFVSVTSESGKNPFNRKFSFCQEIPILADNGVQTTYSRVD